MERNHLRFYDNIEMKERMIEASYANNSTEFVMTHFSHKGGCSHAQTEIWAKENEFIYTFYGIRFNI